VVTGPPAPATELPTYAFDRRRYWLDSRGTEDVSAVGLADAEHGLLGAAAQLAADGTAVLFGHLSAAAQPWLGDHQVGGVTLLPGTAFVELAIRAGDQVGCGQVDELVAEAPLALTEPGGAEIQVTVGQADESGRHTVGIYSRASEGMAWTRHAEAVVAPQRSAPEEPFADLRAWPPPAAEPIPVAGWYDSLRESGYQYGPAFRGLTAAWRRGEAVFAEIELPESATAQAGRFALHPALLDAASHAVGLGGFLSADRIWLPFTWREAAVYAVGATSARVRITPAGRDAVQIAIADPAGQPVALIGSMRARPVDPGKLTASASQMVDGLFHLEWDPVPLGAWRSVPDVAVLGSDTLGLAGLLSADRNGSGPAGTYADVGQLRAALDAGRGLPEGVLVSYLPIARRADGSAAIAAATHQTAERALEMLQRWLADDRLGSIRLIVVTRGAVAAGPGDGVPSLPAAPVWGMVRTAQTEHPGRFALLDLDPAAEPDPAALSGALATAAAGSEPELALRDGKLLAPRLTRTEAATLMLGGDGFGAGAGWRVDTRGGGSLADVAVVPSPEATEPLGDHEVRVQVRAAGINFYDVAVALGLKPGGTGLGGEGAGVVLEVGAAVTGIAPGDRVMGLFEGAFGPVTVADHRMLVPIPDGWSMERAASIPAVFCTAYYALVDLAGLAAGESVVIHAATGGVGTAAVQLARHLGARLFVTAGPGKWQHLRDQGLADEQIASSRSTDFAERFLLAAGGAGVDVVLGSLAGDMVDASLRLLTRGGRYLELGVTDVRDPGEVADLYPGVRYQAFNVADAGPDRIGEILAHLVELFAAGALRPPPVKVWALAELPEALRYLSQARHIGKNVARVPRAADPEGTVIITGGTGTLGRIIASHLVRQHRVKHVLLLSRTGPQAPGADEFRAELAELGASVTIAACDTADRQALAAAIGQVPGRHPVTAVIHASGALSDAALTSLTPAQLHAVLAAKIDPALHLHELTISCDLAAFVSYSSAGATFGSPGQANYTAANTFLDALAHHRAHFGLPATSIAWGLWAQISGMTSHLTDQDFQRMNRSGLAPLATEQALTLFDAATRIQRPHHIAAPIDLTRLPAVAHPLWNRLRAASARPAAASYATDISLADELLRQPPAQRYGSLLEHVNRHLADILGVPRDGVDPQRGFVDSGIDSLSAVELRNRLSAVTGLRLPPTMIFDYPTPDALTRHLAAELLPDGDAEAARRGDDEAAIRLALAGIPLARLREAGLLTPLLRIAAAAGPPVPPNDAQDTDDGSIDAMPVAELMRVAHGEGS
jgi:polyketide synthase 12